tara:strand:- start:114 stop:479 length:366 start_codon:yes stop_codon:yes gene_type:complete
MQLPVPDPRARAVFSSVTLTVASPFSPISLDIFLLYGNIFDFLMFFLEMKRLTYSISFFSVFRIFFTFSFEKMEVKDVNRSESESLSRVRETHTRYKIAQKVNFLRKETSRNVFLTFSDVL